MKSLTEWLRRLTTLRPIDAGICHARLFVPGHEFLDLDNWLVTTEAPTSVPAGVRSGFPETAAVIAFVDENGRGLNLNHLSRFATDLAAAMTLALERRVDIPFEVCTQIENTQTGAFMPVGTLPDRLLTGPLPADYRVRLIELFTELNGLADADVATIGAAMHMLHGAALLYERDLRSAYTLLIAGIEILSRQYGDAPSSWDDWEAHTSWDEFAVESALNPKQIEMLRTRLMNDRHLRLRATFADYGAYKLPDSFWDEKWTEWMYTFHAVEGQWGAPEMLGDKRVREVLVDDRVALRRSLSRSYDLRSRYVHTGVWFGAMDVITGGAEDGGGLLPFALTRAVLTKLIRTELAAHSTRTPLPTDHLVRNWRPNERAI